MNRRQQAKRDGRAGELATQIAAIRAAGVEVTPDYLLGQITIDEAARFLGTTEGQLYNLTSRHEIGFIRWGKRGVRFRRIDLIRWQEGRSWPAAG